MKYIIGEVCKITEENGNITVFQVTTTHRDNKEKKWYYAIHYKDFSLPPIFVEEDKISLYN